MLDIKICHSISSTLEKLTTTGKDILDTKLLIELLTNAGKSGEYLKVCHEKILRQLETDHSEVRYSTVLIIEQLFKRSKYYRDLLVPELDTFLELTVETNFNKLLPKPYGVAKKLKRKTLQLVQSWHSEFGKEYREIYTAYQFLKTRLKVDFEDALKRTTAEVEIAKQKEERQRRINESKVQVLKTEVSQTAEEISKLVTEIRNCFNLLIPKPQNLFDASESEEAGDPAGNELNNDESEEMNLREHGLGLTSSTIRINLEDNSVATVYCNEDNQILFENLKELYLVLKNRFLGKIKSWLKVITRTDDTDFFKQIIDLKEVVQGEINRYEELKIESKNTCDDDGDSNDNDSDFEDVPEKDDYEEFVDSAPVPAPPPQNPTNNNHASTSSSSNGSSWSLWGKSDNDPDDPTTLGATIKRLKKQTCNESNSCDSAVASTSKSALEAEFTKVLTRKEKLLQQAPKLHYDVDLYHWEDENLIAPSVELVESDSHRFWQPSDREGEVIEAADGIASLRTRTIEFTGKFEPVRWSCKVPLPNGKLCPRKDRVKCPFHGNIIERDDSGNPVNPEDAAQLADKQAQEEQDKPPDWQDPVFLKDLQAQIGIDLTVKKVKKGSRKKKTFAEKYPGLTDISKEKKSSRARLARKVFNRNSMKRVGEALDDLQHKKFRDKFGDQYNYAYNE